MWNFDDVRNILFLNLGFGFLHLFVCFIYICNIRDCVVHKIVF